MELEINGHTLAVQVHGPPSARPVVLLHHGLGAIPAWEAQIPALVIAGYRVVAYDRWGYGASQARQGVGMPDFQQDRADLLGLLARLQIERCALVGHSDGGTIALYFTADHPERVACLVTVAAHVYVEPKMAGSVLQVRAAFENEPRLREGLRRLHGEKTEQVFANWFDGWLTPGNLAWDMRPYLSGIGCPALVVQGEADEHATPQHARDIAAAIPQGVGWLVPQADHMLPQRVPEIFNQRLLEFLTENWSSPEN